MRLLQTLDDEGVRDDGAVRGHEGVHEHARGLVGAHRDVLPHPQDRRLLVDDRGAALEGQLVPLEHDLRLPRQDLEERKLQVVVWKTQI